MASTRTGRVPSLLLDTCAVLYLALGSRLSGEASEALGAASQANALWVSPVSAWEIGIGASKGRLKLPLPPLEFYRRFKEALSVRECPVSAEILVSSSFLPGQFHKDPMDRILAASARELDMILVTRDRPILDYGAEGHLRTLAC